MNEMFKSSTRSAGDLAGVFEFDGDVSCFYLFRVDAVEGKGIVDATRIGDGDPPFSESEVDVIWSDDESRVVLQVAGTSVAFFECSKGKK
jgi:hypothetical protein